MKGHEAGLVLGAAQFHETTGRLARMEQIRDEMRRFLDPETGLVRDEFSQWRACPVCGADTCAVLFVKEGFPHVRCQECRMVYVTPILKGELLDSEYGHSRYADSWIDVLLSENQVAFDRPKYLHGLDLMERRTPVGRVLDIGCATGHFLQLARERGWEIQGVELTERAVAVCQERGIPVVQEYLSPSLFPAGCFQAVTFWDVLEHIPDPGAILEQAFGFLAEDGVLLVLVPNIESLAARILRERCNMFSGSAHVNLFSPDSLSGLLTRVGFHVVHCETVISEVNVLNNHLDYQDPYRGSLPPSDHLLGWLDSQAILDRGLGYKVLTVARKARP